MANQDILLDNTNQVEVLRGDFLIGDSDQQHVQTIIEANKGNFLQSPTIGVAIVEFKNGSISSTELSQRIRLELHKDGYRLNKLDVNDFDITIDAQPT